MTGRINVRTIEYRLSYIYQSKREDVDKDGVNLSRLDEAPHFCTTMFVHIGFLNRIYSFKR